MFLNSSKKAILIVFFAILLFISTFLYAVQALQGKVNTAVAVGSADMTTTEQEGIDQKIKDIWGSPSSVQTLTNSTVLANTGDVWYVANGDVNLSSDTTQYINTASNTHIRILLNGYSVSGYFKVRLMGSNNNNQKLSIFDKVTGGSNTGTYNPSPTKYYAYDSATNLYSKYSTSVPSGTDVTDMPTFKADTYIKVVGSAFSPNALNATSQVYINSHTKATINLYSINFVGISTSDGLLVVEDASINAVQCNIIGNASGFYFLVGIWSGSSSKLTLIGCNLYGNITTHTGYGVQPSNTEYSSKSADLSLFMGILDIYKNNIGVITDNVNNTYTKAVFVKGVDFGQRITDFTIATIENKLASLQNASGTIELVYSMNVPFTGVSPKLNFIIHGGSSSSVPKVGGNSLTVASSAEVNGIKTDVALTNGLIIDGTVADLNTDSNVTVENTANVTVGENSRVAATITNSGSLTVLGHVDVLDNKEYATATVNGTATDVDNEGTLRVGGSIAALGCNLGDITIEANGTVIIPQITQIYGEINNAGTLEVRGNIMTTLHNTNLVTVFSLGTIDTLNNNANGVATLDGVVRILNNAANATATISGKVTTITNSGNITTTGNAASNNTIKTLTNNGTATLNNFAKVEEVTNNGTLTAHGNIKTLNNNQTATAIVHGAIENLITDGKITLFNRVQNLTFLSGEIVLQGNTASIAQAVTVPQNATLRVGKDATLSVPVTNMGSMYVEAQARVEDIENQNTLFVANGATVTSINIAANATAEIAGAIQKITSQGELKLNGGATVSNLRSRGNTEVLANASISSLRVEGGYTNLLDNAKVFAAELIDGTLEIQANAASDLTSANLKYTQGKGTLIDRRPVTEVITQNASKNDKSFMIILISVISAVVLLVVVAIIVIIAINKKKKFKRNLEFANKLNAHLPKTQYAENRKAVAAGFQQFKADLKSRVKTAKKKDIE